MPPLPRPLRLFPAAIALAASLASTPALAKKELGVNVHQSPTVGIDVAREAGLGWVRIDLNWLDVEKTQGDLQWQVIDAVVDAAKARNLQVLGVIGYGPAWASSANPKGDGSNNDVPKPDTYAAFVTQVVKRYEGRITHYELWNEPNLQEFFEGTKQDYIDRVLKPGAAALHASCSSCKVVAPGLATVGDQYGEWMDAVLAAAKDDIDIVSGHIYAGFPVDSPNSGKTSDSFYNKLESHRVLEVGGSVLHEGSLSFKEVMDKHGVTKPFWLTETGRQAPISDLGAQEQQRLYYQRVLEAMLLRPWWQNTFFYEAFDEPSTPDLTWGLALHDDAAPGGFKAKSVVTFLDKVIGAQPEFGGKASDCMDFLDNDVDGKIDAADSNCTSGSTSEGTPAAGAGGSSGSSGSGNAAGSAGQPGSGGSAGVGAGGSNPAGAGAPAAGSPGASGAGQGGKGGTGLKGDVDLVSSPDDDGGCAVRPGPRPHAGPLSGLLLALLALTRLFASPRPLPKKRP